MTELSIPNSEIIYDDRGRAKAYKCFLGNQWYTLAPVGLQMWSTGQKAVEQARQQMWEEAVGLAKELKESGKELLLEAYRIRQRTVITTMEEALMWCASPLGDRQQFIRSIRVHHPELKNEEVIELYESATALQLNQWREFQFAAFNPEGIESMLVSAREIENSMDEIPEHLRPDIQNLLDLAHRMAPR